MSVTKIWRKIATVELHTLNGLQNRVTALSIFNGDDAIDSHGTHTIGNQLTDFRVVVGRDCCHLLNLVVALLNLFSLLP